MSRWVCEGVCEHVWACESVCGYVRAPISGSSKMLFFLLTTPLHLQSTQSYPSGFNFNITASRMFVTCFHNMLFFISSYHDCNWIYRNIYLMGVFSTRLYAAWGLFPTMSPTRSMVSGMEYVLNVYLLNQWMNVQE